MEVGRLFGKRTWVGFGASVGTIAILLLLGAFLVVRGLLPYKAVVVWISMCYLVAAFIGGKIAEGGKGYKTSAFMPPLLLYVIIWFLALGCGTDIAFSSEEIYMTVAVLVGTVAAFITGGGKRKRRGKVPKRPVKRTVRR